MSAPSALPDHAAPLADPEPVAGAAQALKSIAVTAAIVGLVVFWPVAMWNRVSEIRDSNLGFQIELADPLLVFGGLILVCLILSLLMMARPLRRYGFMNEVQQGFRDVVAASYFGQGHYGGWTKTNPDAHLGDLEWPAEQSADEAAIDEEAVEPTAAPVPAAPVQVIPVEVVDYQVQRRDSWWRIAETQCGDSDRWEEVRDLNLGREVEPGVALEQDTPLRSGWIVKVPVQS